MKVTKWVEWSGEVEVNVSIADFLASLPDRPDGITDDVEDPQYRQTATLRGMDHAISFILAAKPEDLNDDQRRLIAKHLREQAKRYQPTEATAEKKEPTDAET